MGRLKSCISSVKTLVPFSLEHPLSVFSFAIIILIGMHKLQQIKNLSYLMCIVKKSKIYQKMFFVIPITYFIFKKNTVKVQNYTLLQVMEQVVFSNNILEPIDPLNISFSLQKCKQASNNKTQTPSSSEKMNGNQFMLFQMINQQEKENGFKGDPQSFFGSINLEKSLKNPLQSKQKKNVVHDYYPSSRNQLTNLKNQQQTPQYMRRVFSLKKQPFSQHNNKINIVEDYQRQKFIRSIKYQEKSQKNLSRLHMASFYPRHYPYQQKKKCFSIDKRKDNPIRFGQLFDNKRPYKMYLGSYNHYYSQPSENIDWKCYQSEIQRLNTLINKVDSCIKSPGTPSSSRFTANSIKSSKKKEREYNKIYASSIWQTNLHKYQNYGVDRRVFDQYLQKKSKRR